MFTTIAGNIAAQQQGSLLEGTAEDFALVAQDAKGNDVERSFEVEGEVYSLSSMQSVNNDDADLCAWLLSCEVGDVFPAIVSCRRVS